ncbi:hypothetical protein ESV85_02130 [Algoriphagus aquimarinus]|uniref:Uncharacterized protein n=1 Tax=Algoriphagus aquimarinus TaxID=237018 RepID=A0A5C7B1T2_9BACT|nr:hypothetical protein ESV85_02130 [Algoriphagus aquimarinus]
MMSAILILLWFLFYFCLFSLVAGLVRPVVVLWFMDRMNRLKVLKIYGSATLVILIVLKIFEYYFI